MSMTRQAELTALLADIDQQIAEAKALVKKAYLPAPEWMKANDQFVEHERMRRRVEALLKLARYDGVSSPWLFFVLVFPVVLLLLFLAVAFYWPKRFSLRGMMLLVTYVAVSLSWFRC
jgi:hypothetical protein